MRLPEREVTTHILLSSLTIPVVTMYTMYTTCFNIQMVCILPTEFIYAFVMVFTINSDYVPKQNYLVILGSEDVMSFEFTFYLLFVINLVSIMLRVCKALPLHPTYAVIAWYLRVGITLL
jgi:hypothetical protein